MRKIVLLYMLLLCSGLALAQVRCDVSYSACIDGIYGAWSQTYTDFYYGRFSEVYQIGEYRHPSEYSWKLTLHDFVRPDEKQIKEHYRKKEAWEYSGTLEYYVSDAYPTSLSQLKAFGYLAVAPWNHVVSKGQTPCVKRIQKVSVTILPYSNVQKITSAIFLLQFMFRSIAKNLTKEPCKDVVFIFMCSMYFIT